MNRIARKAFTLVELLIVVVILGILSAILVPQFSHATQDASAGNIQMQLARLQRSLELYLAQVGEAPDFNANAWGDMISRSYIKFAPLNPAWNGTAAAESVETGAGTTSGSATAAWVWNTDRKQICASNFREASFFTTDVNIVTQQTTD